MVFLKIGLPPIGGVRVSLPESFEVKTLVIAATAAMLAAFLVTPAGADPIADREANMKQRAEQMKILGPIAQGKAPYDGAAVQTALDTLHTLAQNASDNINTLWPEGSVGGKSSPKIWENWDAFVERSAKFAADTGTAANAKPADLESFQAVFGPVGQSCGGCHEQFRT